jgi:biotin-(acetyl-CoA carboxylase) ligase
MLLLLLQLFECACRSSKQTKGRSLWGGGWEEREPQLIVNSKLEEAKKPTENVEEGSFVTRRPSLSWSLDSMV